MSDIFKDYEGRWAFVKADSDKYIGRIVNDGELNDGLQPLVDVNGFMYLQPALQYIAEYVQDKQGNIAKQLLITPVEVCVGFESKIKIKGVDLIILFDDMSAEDKRQFEKAVRQGVDMTTEARAAKAGITLESSMPGNDSNGIIFQ